MFSFPPSETDWVNCWRNDDDDEGAWPAGSVPGNLSRVKVRSFREHMYRKMYERENTKASAAVSVKADGKYIGEIKSSESFSGERRNAKTVFPPPSDFTDLHPPRRMYLRVHSRSPAQRRTALWFP